MSRHVQTLFRYPVKGFSEEPLTQVRVVPGAGFPMDRALAITDGKWLYDRATYAPKNKLEFIGLMGQPQVALLRLASDHAATKLSIAFPNGPTLEVDVETGAGADELIDRLISFLHMPENPRPSLVRGDAGAFTDFAMLNRANAHQGNTQFAISVINLASLRDLESRMGCSLDPLRFRANVYYDGEQPWEEQDWFGRYVRMGTAVGKVVMSTPRCAIPSVNPRTGARDANVLQGLMKHYKHKDLGFYLDIVDAGAIGLGDPVELVTRAQETHHLVTVPLNGVSYSVYVNESPLKAAAAS